MPVLIKGSGGAQKTPTISVSTSGLITATAGSKSATKQLSTRAGGTITPNTSQQTAVSKNYYTTGAVYVAGDSNLVSSNIKSGVSIFGVYGTFPVYSEYKGNIECTMLGNGYGLAVTVPGQIDRITQILVMSYSANTSNSVKLLAVAPSLSLESSLEYTGFVVDGYDNFVGTESLNPLSISYNYDTDESSFELTVKAGVSLAFSYGATYLVEIGYTKL